MLAYFLENTRFTATTVMDNVGAIAGSPTRSGRPGQGHAQRRVAQDQFYDLVSNAQPTARANCTGIRFNCTANTLTHISNIWAMPRTSARRWAKVRWKCRSAGARYAAGRAGRYQCRGPLHQLQHQRHHHDLEGGPDLDLQR